MKRTTLSPYRKRKFSKFFTEITGEAAKSVSLVTTLNDEEVLWEVKGETKTIAITTINSEIVTYGDSKEMYLEEEPK